MGEPHGTPDAATGPNDGFVRPSTPESLEAAQRELRATLPKPDIPPMANVALLRELVLNEGGTREVSVQGTVYRAPPLGYLDGLAMSRLAQDLDRVLSGERVFDQLPELRATYRGLADIFKRALLPLTRGWRAQDDPFARLTAGEFRQLALVLLHDGNEHPVPPAVPRPGAVYRPYDATAVLLGYLTTVGHLPGWVIPPGLPASWRHYCVVRDFLTRREANDQLAHFLATIMPQVSDKDLRAGYLDDLQRRSDR